MKAITFQKPGDASVLQISEIPIPKPNSEQLLVKVHAAALNRADILQRLGKYPPLPGESEILGLEIAGEVVDFGNQVNRFTKGQKVFGLVGGGGYAEYCLIDHQMALTIPEQWTYEFAAAIPEAFLTVQLTLFDLVNLKAGDVVLIHAAASGVGTAAIQMAKYCGAKVYCTVGSPEKINQLIQLGVDGAINYKTEDFFEKIMSLTQQRGVDVILDCIGANYFSRNINLLKVGGSLIQIAAMSGNNCAIDLILLIYKRLQIKGFVLRTRTLQEKRAYTETFKQTWLPILIAGKIKPIIDKVFPFEQVQLAHQRMENNENFGKILLTI